MRWLETKDIRSPENDRRYVQALAGLVKLGFSVQMHGDGSVGIYQRGDTPGLPVAVASKAKRLPATLRHLRRARQEQSRGELQTPSPVSPPDAATSGTLSNNGR